MEPGESCHRRPRFRICSRSWFLTYPKCSLGKEEALALLKAKRPAKGIVVARELHEDGTPHLHAYVMLNAEFNCTASSYWDLQGWHGNYQHAKSWCKVLAYIKKDQDYLQEGDLDVEHKARAREAHTAYLGRRLQTEPLARGSRPPRAATQLRSVEGKPACLLAGHPGQRPQARSQGHLDHRTPGVGKTHSVISAEPSLYRKAQNKWWDGYVGQPAVLIDDFDETGASLHHYLKLWADRWAHTGRSKGAMSPVTTGCT